MDVSDVANVRSLTEENERLKRIVAELRLDNDAYKILVEKTVGALSAQSRGEGASSQRRQRTAGVQNRRLLAEYSTLSRASFGR
jgi:hypothetical protein